MTARAQQQPQQPEQLLSLNLDEQYCPSWTAANGVRELVQNWHDAILAVCLGGAPPLVERAGGDHEFTAHRCGGGTERVVLGGIRWDAAARQLVLWNKSTGELGTGSLGIGATSKRRRGEHGAVAARTAAAPVFAGGHGEGLKVGALALIRAGRSVEVTIAAGAVSGAGAAAAGPETRWRFVLRGNRLHVHASSVGPGGSLEPGVVRVEVAGAEGGDFSPKDYLFLCPPPAGSVFVGQGSRQQQQRVPERLLLGQEHAGRLYCRGILVEARRSLVCGYELDIDIGRDRVGVSSLHALRTSAGYLWADAIMDREHGQAFARRFAALLQEEPRSLEAELPGRFWLGMIDQFPYHAVAELHLGVRALQRHFRARHPPDALPCSAAERDAAALSLGRPMVVCSDALLDVLQCAEAVGSDGARPDGLAYETCRRLRRARFADPSVRTTKNLGAEPYASTVAAITRAAAAAFRGATVRYVPANVAALDVLRLPSPKLDGGDDGSESAIAAPVGFAVSDRWLDPSECHERVGGCIGVELGAACRCCEGYIVSHLLARAFGEHGGLRSYCAMAVRDDSLKNNE